MPPLDPHESPATSPLAPLAATMASRDGDAPTLVAEALRAGRVRIALQPVVAADGRRIAFYEGLVRLVDERGRILPAGAFLPGVAEDGLGRELDRAALDAGLALLARRADLRLLINMSARSVADGAWRSTLARWLASEPGIGPRLILEMTESSVMLLPEILVRFMEEMQPQGVCFALDDFGSSAIALRHMKDFLFDLVKIDRHFGTQLDTSSDDRVIVEALLSIARQFEMFSVAQGVETEAAARLYTALGADCLQGFHIGVPKLSA